MSKGDVGAALAHYKAALTTLDDQLEKVLASGDAESVRNALRDLRLAIESHAVVREVSEALPHIKPFGNVAEDAIVREFSAQEIISIQTEIRSLFERVRANPAVIDELMPPMMTSAGEKTLDQPRRLVVNGERFLVKDFSENVNKAKNELVGYRLAKKLEINSPGCAEISWVDGAGKSRCVLVQRFVPDASDLGKIDRGTALVLKKHIAEDRVLSMLLGDPDRRSRNFMITAEGRVYGIDRGESSIIETLDVHWDSGSGEQLQKEILDALQARHKSYRFRIKEMWPIIEAIDNFITPGDMEEIFDRISRLDLEGADLRDLLLEPHQTEAGPEEPAIRPCWHNRRFHSIGSSTG